MQSVVLNSSSLEDTARIAKLILENLPKNSIALSGKLGAGKTAFVRFLALALGIKEQITSPTYTFEQQYEISGNDGFTELHHWDLYRAGSGDFVQEIGELLSDRKKLVIVEWPEKVPAIEDLLYIKILIDSPALLRPENDENHAYLDDGRRVFKISCDPESVLFQALKKYI